MRTAIVQSSESKTVATTSTAYLLIVKMMLFAGSLPIFISFCQEIAYLISTISSDGELVEWKFFPLLKAVPNAVIVLGLTFLVVGFFASIIPVLGEWIGFPLLSALWAIICFVAGLLADCYTRTPRILIGALITSVFQRPSRRPLLSWPTSAICVLLTMGVGLVALPTWNTRYANRTLSVRKQIEIRDDVRRILSSTIPAVASVRLSNLEYKIETSEHLSDEYQKSALRKISKLEIYLADFTTEPDKVPTDWKGVLRDTLSVAPFD